MSKLREWEVLEDLPVAQQQFGLSVPGKALWDPCT